MGPRPACAWLQLFPLRARSVGQLLGILVRHRLHPEGGALARGGPQAGGFVLSMGARRPTRIHDQLRGRRELTALVAVNDPDRRSHSTTILTFSPGFS